LKYTLQILLHLGPFIEDAAVSVTAEYVMMQTALTPLTLRPKLSEAFLQLVDFDQFLSVNGNTLVFTVLANCSLCQWNFATQTRVFYNGKFSKP
jgi:hypothetical protein